MLVSFVQQGASKTRDITSETAKQKVQQKEGTFVRFSGFPITEHTVAFGEQLD